MSEWSSHIAAQKCTVQLRRLVRMRFLYQPIIPPRMVATGFLSRRSGSLVSCGRTEPANAITALFGEKSGRFDVRRVLLEEKWRSEVFFASRRSRNSNRLYGLLTTCGAGLFASICALTFWICAACRSSRVVRASICFCCASTLRCSFRNSLSSIAYRLDVFLIAPRRAGVTK